MKTIFLMTMLLDSLELLSPESRKPFLAVLLKNLWRQGSPLLQSRRQVKPSSSHYWRAGFRSITLLEVNGSFFYPWDETRIPNCSDFSFPLKRKMNNLLNSDEMLNLRLFSKETTQKFGTSTQKQSAPTVLRNIMKLGWSNIPSLGQTESLTTNKMNPSPQACFHRPYWGPIKTAMSKDNKFILIIVNNFQWVCQRCYLQIWWITEMSGV